jgi:hypothetical protein
MTQPNPIESEGADLDRHDPSVMKELVDGVAKRKARDEPELPDLDDTGLLREICIVLGIKPSATTTNPTVRNVEQLVQSLLNKARLEELTNEQFSSDPGYRLKRIAELEARLKSKGAET